MIFSPLNQRYGVIIALHKCVFVLEQFLGDLEGCSHVPRCHQSTGV